MISKRRTVRRILGTVAATGVLGLLLWNAAAQGADPGQDMIQSLGASSPHSSLGDQAQVFDRFVGTWDCDYSFYRDDGTVRHSKGELLVGWILDGRAVQDIFITYPAEGEKDRRKGVNKRESGPGGKTEQPSCLQAAHIAGRRMEGRTGQDRNQTQIHAYWQWQRVDGGISPRDRSSNVYHVHCGWRPSYCHALLQHGKPTTDDDENDRGSVRQELDVFAVTRLRLENARRLAQHGVDRHARGHTASYPSVDL